MWGTLAQGDCLWSSPVTFDSLQIGDVVAFDSGGKIVAHRIVGREGTGWVSQGDGNWSRDSALLTAGCIIGKVVERERKGIRRSVAGGAKGRRKAVLVRALCRSRLRLESWLAKPYRMIRASRMVPWLWRPLIVSARFIAPSGPITKFIHRGKTVAVWLPQAGQWTCRAPYDLILFPPVR